MLSLAEMLPLAAVARGAGMMADVTLEVLEEGSVAVWRDIAMVLTLPVSSSVYGMRAVATWLR